MVVKLIFFFTLFSFSLSFASLNYLAAAQRILEKQAYGKASLASISAAGTFKAGYLAQSYRCSRKTEGEKPAAAASKTSKKVASISAQYHRKNEKPKSMSSKGAPHAGALLARRGRQNGVIAGSKT